MSARGFEVVVIGGGVAGLAAASTLVREGISTLLVEARQRLGGLVFSASDERGLTEHGAEFVHDTSHAIAHILKNSGAAIRPVPENVRYVRDGALLPNLDPWACAMRAIKAEIAAYSGKCITVGEILRSLAGKYPADALQRAANAISSHEGAPVEDLSMAVLEYHGDTLTEHARIDGGFGLLVDSLSAGFESILGCPVARVSHDSSGVRVFDQAGKRVVDARCAIIAIPLGVLQSGSVVFEPPLESGHCEALQSLRMNRTIKVILRFSKRLFAREEFLSLPGPVPEMWSSPWEDGEKLIGFSGGQLLLDNGELFSDPKAVTEHLLETLETVFGSIARSCFHSSEVVDWSLDPYARGSCSYSASGARGSDVEARRVLGTSIQGRLFFCGEATNFAGAHGTVHGAYDTGIRAAIEALKTLRGE